MSVGCPEMLFRLCVLAYFPPFFVLRFRKVPREWSEDLEIAKSAGSGCSAACRGEVHSNSLIQNNYICAQIKVPL
jgi:hypothetical protein